jgi:hypothetical protein
MNGKTASGRKAIVWHDISDWGVEGKGWRDTQRFYDRLPRRARRNVFTHTTRKVLIANLS